MKRARENSPDSNTSTGTSSRRGNIGGFGNTINDSGTLDVMCVKREYRWVIDKFTERNGIIESQTFNGPADRSKWCLHLYPYGKSEESRGKMCIYLILLESPVQVKPSFAIKIVKRNGDQRNAIFFEHNAVFSKTENAFWCNMMEHSIAIDETEGCLVDNNLTILCKIEIFNPRLDDEKYLANLEAVDKSTELKDCELEGDDGVHACKALLSAQSPVFLSMFQGNSKEAQTSRVENTGFKKEVIRELVRFSNCGKVANMVEVAEDLLVAADKYNIIPLMEICAQYMCETLKKENVCIRLVISYRHNIANLKEASIAFLKENIEEFNELEGSEELFTPEHKGLLMEIMRTIARK